MTIEEAITELGDSFVGLWSYKRSDHPRSYCSTICLRGNHIDTKDYDSPLGALMEGIALKRGLTGK